MKSYTVYLPNHTHEPLPIATIEYHPERNAAFVYERGKATQEYLSLTAAFAALRCRFDNAFLEEM